MLEANFTVSSMHGDMPQKERDAIMKDFRTGQRYKNIVIKYLICLHNYINLSTLLLVNRMIICSNCHVRESCRIAQCL